MMNEMDEMFDHIIKSVETTRRYHEAFFDAMNFDYAGAYKDYVDK